MFSSKPDWSSTDTNFNRWKDCLFQSHAISFKSCWLTCVAKHLDKIKSVFYCGKYRNTYDRLTDHIYSGGIKSTRRPSTESANFDFDLLERVKWTTKLLFLSKTPFQHAQVVVKCLRRQWTLNNKVEMLKMTERESLWQSGCDFSTEIRENKNDTWKVLRKKRPQKFISTEVCEQNDDSQQSPRLTCFDCGLKGKDWARLITYRVKRELKRCSPTNNKTVLTDHWFKWVVPTWCTKI